MNEQTIESNQKNTNQLGNPAPRRGKKLLVTLVVLIALLGAGYWIFTRYLFPISFTPVELSEKEQRQLDNKLNKYIIKDRSGKELQSEYHDIDFVSRDDILASEGYKLLEDKISSLGVKLSLQEEPCREYDDEERVRYLISLSGWD